MDYTLNHGDAIFSPFRSGTVTFAGRTTSHQDYGIFVSIKADNGKYVSLSAHLSGLASGIECGATVDRHTVIGFAGDSNGPTFPVGRIHLHQAFYRYPTYTSAGVPYDGRGLQALYFHYYRGDNGIHKLSWSHTSTQLPRATASATDARQVDRAASPPVPAAAVAAAVYWARKGTVQTLKVTLKRLLLTGAPRRFLSIAVLVLADAVAMLAGIAAASYFTEGRISRPFSLAPVLLAVWVCVFAAYDLYNRARVRRNPGALLGAALVWAGLLVVGEGLYPESGLTAGMVLLAAFVALVLDGALRLLYERAVELLYRRGLGRIPTIIIGDEAGRTRVRGMMEQTSGAYACVAEIDLGEGTVDLYALRATLDNTGARSVVLVGGERLPDEDLLDLLRSVRLRGVRMQIVPGALTLMRSQPTVSQSLGLPLVEVRYPRLDNTQRLMKRTLDVTLSAAGLVVLSPLFLTLALFVKSSSPGPVLFRQKRAGADEEVFVCLMFRSMYEHAELRQPELEDLNEAEGAAFKIRKDPRVTPFGRFLRRWSLDELPQLVNVLKGEMSLVGPRPLPLRDFERMGELHKRRLAALPGMTGLWQISGRSNLPFEEMVRLDLFYIENWSLSFDVKIILRTLGAVLRREGAY